MINHEEKVTVLKHIETQSDMVLYTDEYATVMQGVHRAAESLRDSNAQLSAENLMLDEVRIFDSKTGLLKNEVFEEKVRERTMIHGREGDTGKGGVFALLDLDKFKQINTDFGYARTDTEFLIPAATNLKSVIRGEDLAGRFGGEEFMVYLANTTLEDGKKVFDRLYDKLADQKFGTDIDGNPILIADRDHLGVSIGIVEFPEGADFKERFEAANKLLTLAKENGRNRYMTENQQLVS